jgi:hypothetical protein
MGPNRLDPNLIPLFFFCAAAGAIVGSLVGAILLRAGAEFAENLQIKFGDAFLTVFLASLANGAVAVLIGVAYGAASPPAEFRRVAFICCYPLSFLIQSVIISARHNLSFWKGLRISFYIALIWVVLLIAVAIVVIPILYLMGGLHR